MCEVLKDTHTHTHKIQKTKIVDTHNNHEFTYLYQVNTCEDSYVPIFPVERSGHEVFCISFENFRIGHENNETNRSRIYAIPIDKMITNPCVI